MSCLPLVIVGFSHLHGRQTVLDRINLTIAAAPDTALSGAGRPGFRQSASARLCAELMSRSEIAAAGYFDPAAVERLLAKAQSRPAMGGRDQMAFLGVLSTQLWHDAFIKKPVAPFEDRSAGEHERCSSLT